MTCSCGELHKGHLCWLSQMGRDVTYLQSISGGGRHVWEEEKIITRDRGNHPTAAVSDRQIQETV